ncbi:MAG: disulfide bond formation protein DsbA [Rubrivivax sp.]|nr:MAG: disulfide bond formation protein DsbA [Rubrivivax sp.]
MRPYGFLGAGIAIGVLLGAALMNMSGSSVANAAGTANVADKAAVEAIVKDYIAAHGEELSASIQAAGERQQLARLNQMLGNSNVPTKGPMDAPVTVVEFSDYQCPFCDRVQGTLSELRTKYGNQVRWVYKNLPLDFHPEAKPAAYAALAAQKQGKFWEYHDMLWQRQASLGDKTYVAIAQELKLDMDAFNKDRASADVKAQVETDMADAENMGARGTPHFVINGEQLSGAVPASEFVRVIDAKLKK